jgi:integrase
VDLEKQDIQVRRSKTEAGERHLPLNRDAVVAFARLWQRAELLGSTAPEHYVFPTCQRALVDPLKPQVTWCTAWRKLTVKADPPGFRFHDLRHQAITELAEKGISDATLMASHMSRKMLEHYSHVGRSPRHEANDLAITDAEVKHRAPVSPIAG